jgi:L-ascorbate metabolism protein UlaG (beta-lactamase superfamily)
MIEPRRQGRQLLDEIDRCECLTPTLWWLGHSGFAIKYHSIVFYIDPCLSDPRGKTRVLKAPLTGSEITNADIILCTHKHAGHMDPLALPAMLKASPRARVVLPKSIAGRAAAIGIPYERMTTTDSDMRVEYFKQGVYGRVYSVPAAHPGLHPSPVDGHPCLGYLMRFDEFTIYHAGDGLQYDGMASRLRPYHVTAALMPINGDGNFDTPGAAQLAEDIEARWLVPMHYGTFAGEPADINHFVDHMLGHRPSIKFKVFEAGEGWAIPSE